MILPWQNMKRFALALVALFCAISVRATEHEVHLQINNGGDTIGWHFSRYDGQKEWSTIYGLPAGIPLGSNFTKIYSQDDSSRRMFRGERFDQTFIVQGPGIYILDFSD
jgi:hypothetical protein